MLLYAASAFLLLNALTTLAREDPSRKCEDNLDENFCRLVLKRGQCTLGSHAEYAERNCWKTCGHCTPVTPKPEEVYYFANGYQQD
nr:Metridin ShK toxin domain containing protein [Haemonchus contortus]